MYSEGPKKGKGAVKRVEREQVAAAVEKYAATVYRVALSCVKNRESAEDIMQDVFLKLLRRTAGTTASATRTRKARAADARPQLNSKTRQKARRGVPAGLSVRL